MDYRYVLSEKCRPENTNIHPWNDAGFGKYGMFYVWEASVSFPAIDMV